MKKYFVLGAAMLISMFTIVLSSCNDDEVSQPTIQLTEVGYENNMKGTAGEDFHLEADIVAEGLIQSITVDVLSNQDGKSLVSEKYTSGKYIGVKNAEFHEHLDIPATASAGSYKVIMTVADGKGQIAKAEVEITIEVPDPTAPKIVLKEVGESNSQKGVSGEKFYFDAHISAPNKIQEIVLEFHKTDNTYEKEIDLTGAYQGLTEADFQEYPTIPADAPAGEYHIHFSVKDEKNLTTTAEVEGFAINK